MMLSAVVWTGGSTGNWDDPANWSSNTLPGPNDDVSIGSGVSVVHSDDDSDSIGSLTSSGPLSIEGGTLSIASASTVGTLTINDTTSPSTTLTVDGPLTVNGLLSLSGSTISGSGTITDNGGTFLHNGTLDGPTLINPAGQTATFAPGSESSILMEDGAEFDNIGSFLDQSDYGFVQGTGASSSFTNQGSLKVSMNGGASVFDVLFNMRGGTVDVQGTYLVLGGGGTETGAAFTVESGAGLDFEGSTPFALDSGTTFSGAGNLAAASPPLTLSGDSASFTGPTEVYFGDTLIVDGSLAGSEQTVKSGATLGGSGTVGAIVNDGTISPGDSATITGVLKADGNVTFESGSTFNIASNGISAGTGYDQLDATGTVSLGGAALTGTLGFTPTDGESFPIIESTAPIVGTFAGLPQGASLTIGGVPFTISYTGGASGDDVVLTQAATTTTPPTATTTSLGSSANPSMPGQTVTFTAIVAPTSGTSTPIGNVTFTIDGQTQTPVALGVINGVDEATLTTSTLRLGSNTISAAYSGNSAFSSSGVPNPLTQTVNATQLEATAIKLMSSANPATVGQPVTLTATVTGPKGAGTPTGSVSFDAGNTVLSTVDLNSTGQATFTTSALALGSNTITAVFTPTGDFSGGSSTALSQVVNAAPLEATATRVTSSNGASSVGQAVTFTAFVTTTGPGTPGGTVTFTIDGQPQPPVTLAVESGVDEASFTTTALTAGSSTIGATYNGAPSFAASQAIPQAQSVSPAVSKTPPSTDGPRITLVQRYGYHMGQTSIVLTFDQALDAVTAEDAKDYRIVGPARQTIAVRKAVYDPADLTVTLYPVDRINIHHTYTLIVDGTSPHGLTNTRGQLLHGANTGSPDGNYDGLLTWRNLVLDPLPKGWHASKT